MSDEVQVNITAQDDTAEGIKSAENGMDGLEEKGSSVADELIEKFAGLFAAEKVIDFAEKSVEAFASVDRGLNVLAAQGRANGENIDAMRGKTQAFLETTEATWGTSKEVILSALNDAELKTHDYATALKIVDDAEKLSIPLKKDAASIERELALAVQGNSKGVRQLGKDLGLTTEGAKNTDLVFNTLEKDISTMGDVTGDATGQINSMSALWKDTMENVGGTLSTLIPVVTLVEKILATDLQEVFGMGKLIVDTFVLVGSEIVAVGNLVDNLVHGHFVVGIKSYAEQAGQAMFQMGKDMKADVLETGAAIDKIWTGNTEKVEIETDKQLRDKVKANLDANTQIGEQDDEALKEELDMQDLMDALEDEALKEAVEEAKKAEEEKRKALEETQREYKRDGQEVERLTQTATENMIKAAVTGKETWQEAGKAMAKEGIDAVAQILMQQGAADLFISAADATNELTMAAAPGFFASGMAKEAGAGVIEGAAAAFLDQGGLATEPTLAVIAEKRPEAVIPLEEMGSIGGLGGGEIHMHFPGIQKTSDFNAQMHRSAARQMISTFDDMNRRRGIRKY